MSDLAPTADEVGDFLGLDLDAQVAAAKAGDTEGLMTYAKLRQHIDRVSDELGEWQGIPIPIQGTFLHLADNHPMRAAMAQLDLDLAALLHKDDDYIHVYKMPDDEKEMEVQVNFWYSRQRHTKVWVMKNGHGRARASTQPLSFDQATRRLTMAMQTLNCVDAWDLEAEYKAREILKGMLNEHKWRQYELTGSFQETSPRSDITYLFRKLRPTVASSPRARWGDHDGYMRILAVLCLHPIGFYEGTWAGCMVPTDDVVAHLTMMRGDEADFWAKANQHEPWEPEAGL